jgi:hypothetical protein
VTTRELPSELLAAPLTHLADHSATATESSRKPSTMSPPLPASTSPKRSLPFERAFKPLLAAQAVAQSRADALAPSTAYSKAPDSPILSWFRSPTCAQQARRRRKRSFPGQFRRFAARVLLSGPCSVMEWIADPLASSSLSERDDDELQQYLNQITSLRKYQ